MDGNDDLGGSIQLSGFRDVEEASMIVLNKTIRNYASRFKSRCRNFETLKLSMKKVHELERSEKYEVHAMIVEDGRKHASTVTERSLLAAVDSVLKKIESIVSRREERFS